MRMRSEGWINEEYYSWLVGMIPNLNRNYSRLLRLLHEIPFRVVLLMDENRVSDGLALRARFAMQKNLDSCVREMLKTAFPCSVLEVMVALSVRLEEDYMTEYGEDNPIGRWLGPMIDSLGLTLWTDRHFEERTARIQIGTFLDRAYLPDGQGGLFYVPGAQVDMRKIELWQQMMMWVEYYKNTRGGN